MTNLADTALLVLSIVVLALIYFLPAGVAVYRHHRSAVAILVINILAGWTVIGWLGTLAWAVIGERSDS